MTDEQTSKADTGGKKVDKSVANIKEASKASKETSGENEETDKTPLEKLKASNDEFEKELIRGRELEAERQKLEANAMLGGTAGGNVPVETKDPDQEFADKLLADEE